MPAARRSLAAALLLAAAVALGACSPGIGAQIEVVEPNAAFRSPEPTNVFVRLADATPAPETAYVARLRVTVTHRGRSTLDLLYPALRDRANALGANAYRVQGGCSGPGPCEVAVDLYRVPGEVLDGQPDPLPDGTVYVFGALTANGRPVRFSLNGEPAEVPPLRYLAYPATPGEEVRIAVGDRLLGAAVTLPIGEGRAPSFWSLTGASLGPAAGGGGGGVGVSFNTGRVYQVDSVVGRFLVAMLEEEVR